VTGVVKAHPFHAIPHHSTLLWNGAGVPSVPQCSTSPEHCGTPPTFTDVPYSHHNSVNLFAVTWLKDLASRISSLEEGVPERHDTTFHETFSHFTELMTGLGTR